MMEKNIAFSTKKALAFCVLMAVLVLVFPCTMSLSDEGNLFALL